MGGYDVSESGLCWFDNSGCARATGTKKISMGGAKICSFEEIRLTVAGPVAGTVIDLAKLGVQSMLVGAGRRNDEKDASYSTL